MIENSPLATVPVSGKSAHGSSVADSQLRLMPVSLTGWHGVGARIRCEVSSRQFRLDG